MGQSLSVSLPSVFFSGSAATDSLSWEVAYEQCYHELCEYVIRFVGSREVAEDLVEDLFFYLWTTRRTWETARLTRAYLFVSVRNRAIHYLRHRQVAQRWIAGGGSEPIPTWQTPADLYLDRELEDAVFGSISELPNRCRRVFMLRRWDELSYAEIAHRTGLSVPTVKSHLYRATLILRTKLEPYLAPVN